jgi:recombination protein RecR
MSDYAEPIERLIDEFRKLPGIGAKSAQRLAYSILRRPREDAERLSRAIVEAKDKICYCSRCNNFSDRDPCYYCNNTARSPETICVVEEPHDILAIEKTGNIAGSTMFCMAFFRPSMESVPKTSSSRTCWSG